MVSIERHMRDLLGQMDMSAVRDFAQATAEALAGRKMRLGPGGLDLEIDAAHWLRAADVELKGRTEARRNVRAMGDEG